MANWVRLGNASEIPAGGCRVFEAGDCTVAVFKVEGSLHAIDNTCLHRGGPLGEGTLEGKIVTCPWHHWQYDVTTGKTTMSSDMGVRKYPLEVRGDDVFVELG